jgi:hypothetical protein
MDFDDDRRKQVKKKSNNEEKIRHMKAKDCIAVACYRERYSGSSNFCSEAF